MIKLFLLLLTLLIAVTPIYAQDSAVLDTLQTEICCFDALVYALENSEMNELLREGEYTVFAVANENITPLETDLLSPFGNPLTLVGMMRYHIALGRYEADDLLDGAALSTLDGGMIHINRDEFGQIILNGVAQVRDVNIDAGNAIIHTVDRVLFPPQVAGRAWVRIANFTNFDSINANIDYNEAAALQSIEQGDISEWLEIRPGLHRIGVAPGDGPQLSLAGPNDIILFSEMYTTIAVIGAQQDGLSSTRLVPLRFLGTPSETEASVMFFYTDEEDLSHPPTIDPIAVDILIDGVKAIEGLQAPDLAAALDPSLEQVLTDARLYSPSTNLPPFSNDGSRTIRVVSGTHRIDVVRAGTSGPALASLTNAGISANKRYIVTLYAGEIQITPLDE